LEEFEAQGRSLVFLDESGLDWGAKGRTNVIGALLSGVLLTISVFETTINTVIFQRLGEPRFSPQIT
jgi:hypothetical protein